MHRKANPFPKLHFHRLETYRLIGARFVSSLLFPSLPRVAYSHALVHFESTLTFDWYVDASRQTLQINVVVPMNDFRNVTVYR